MNQIRLYATLPRKSAEKVAATLERALEDEGVPISAFEADADAVLWTVSLYAPADEPQRFQTTLEAALGEHGLDVPVETETLGDTDWVTLSLQGLAPVRAGRFIVHGSHDSDVPQPHEYGLLIDAGQAFGTGHHGTTSGCLEAIGEILKRRTFRRVLDLGTGSGVLAIGYASAARRKALATDIDPVAVAVARDNCRINHVASLVKCVTATGFRHRQIAASAPYDLIIANILAGPLQSMATSFARHAAPGSVAILSGLLPHQQTRICATFRAHGFAFRQKRIRDGWLTLTLEKSLTPQAAAYAADAYNSRRMDAVAAGPVTSWTV